MKQNWAKYYQDAGEKPSSLATLAVTQVGAKGGALDIGSGNGRDLKYLMSRGFSPLVGIEPSEDAPEYPQGIMHIKKTAQEALLDDKELVPAGSLTLVLCINTLFFVDKQTTHRLLARMNDVVAFGGVYAFNLLGEYDQWVEEKKPDVSHFTRGEINALREFHPFIRECYSGNERDGTLANGTPHHWHLHNFVCRKG
jgi:SAM-dependent methyltransferase